MNILGMGPLEIFFILLIAFIVFGAKDLEKAGRTIGEALNRIVRSDTWRAISRISRKLKTLPNDLMREAGMDELKKTMAPLDEEIAGPSRPGQHMPEAAAGETALARQERRIEGPSPSSLDEQEPVPEKPKKKRRNGIQK